MIIKRNSRILDIPTKSCKEEVSSTKTHSNSIHQRNIDGFTVLIEVVKFTFQRGQPISIKFCLILDKNNKFKRCVSFFKGKQIIHQSQWNSKMRTGKIKSRLVFFLNGSCNPIFVNLPISSVMPKYPTVIPLQHITCFSEDLAMIPHQLKQSACFCDVSAFIPI